MASPREFAIRMRRLGDRVADNADALVVRTAAAIDQILVTSTPVDTGRARANWVVGLSEPVTEATSETDKSGQATIQRNESKIRERRSGQDIYISNNVEYIVFLNQGSSAQAPAMFVEQAVAAGARAVAQARLLR